MQAGTRVRITKTGEKKPNHNGVFDGYWVEGFLAQDLRILEPVILDRRVRNGIKALGTFTTTPITFWHYKAGEPLRIETENSAYSIEVL